LRRVERIPKSRTRSIASHLSTLRSISAQVGLACNTPTEDGSRAPGARGLRELARYSRGGLTCAACAMSAPAGSSANTAEKIRDIGDNVPPWNGTGHWPNAQLQRTSRTEEGRPSTGRDAVLSVPDRFFATRERTITEFTPTDRSWLRAWDFGF